VVLGVLAFRGANKPKLVNVIVSQKRRITRNGTGTDDSVPASTNQRVCSGVPARSRASIPRLASAAKPRARRPAA
jgi:hypothetical protein